MVLGRSDMARELAQQGERFLRERKDPAASLLENYTRRLFPGESP
jgi:hypothetical protein